MEKPASLTLSGTHRHSGYFPLCYTGKTWPESGLHRKGEACRPRSGVEYQSGRHEGTTSP